MYGPESEARAFPLQHKPGLESICHLLTEEQKQPAPSVSCGSNLNVIWYIYYSDWSSGLCVANRRTWFAGGNCHVRGPRHYEGLWWRFIWVGFFHWTCLLFTCENIPYMAGLTIDSLTYTGVRTVLNCAVKPDKHGMCKARHKSAQLWHVYSQFSEHTNMFYKLSCQVCSFQLRRLVLHILRLYIFVTYCTPAMDGRFNSI